MDYRAYAFLPAQVAVVKGFFKDEALEPFLPKGRFIISSPAPRLRPLPI